MIRRLLVVLTLLGIAASGCTLGPRETWAESMRNASETAAKIGSSHVHVTVALKVIQTTIRVVPSPLFQTLDGVVDYKDRVSKLAARGGGGTAKSPTIFYDDLVTYFPRAAGSISDHASNRHWSRFDFKRKPKPDKTDATDRLASLGYVISPSVAVEMLQGVLAGSLKTEGTSQMDGASVTEYSGKLAPDAVTRDLRQQPRVDGITRMFKIIGVAQDLFHFKAWVDQQGLARRIQLILPQTEDVVDKFQTTVDYTFSKYGPASTINLPPRSDCLDFSRFVEFAAEYTRASI